MKKQKNKIKTPKAKKKVSKLEEKILNGLDALEAMLFSAASVGALLLEFGEELTKTQKAKTKTQKGAKGRLAA